MTSTLSAAGDDDNDDEDDEDQDEDDGNDYGDRGGTLPIRFHKQFNWL